MKGSCGWRHFPTLRHWTNICYDFTMVRPGVLNSIVGSNSSSSWITRWTEPMVLRCTCSSGTKSTILSTIHCVAKNVLWPLLVVRDNSCSEMIWDWFEYIKNSFQLSICILCNNLELTEKLFTQDLSFCFSSKVLERNENSSWLPWSVLLWDVVSL